MNSEQLTDILFQLDICMPAFGIGAKVMGISVREFHKALNAGTVASDEFLPGFLALINETYGQNTERKVEWIIKLAAESE